MTMWFDTGNCIQFCSPFCSIRWLAVLKSREFLLKSIILIMILRSLSVSADLSNYINFFLDFIMFPTIFIWTYYLQSTKPWKSFTRMSFLKLSSIYTSVQMGGGAWWRGSTHPLSLRYLALDMDSATYSLNSVIVPQFLYLWNWSHSNHTGLQSIYIVL